jgi:epoxyqueuosine reductase
VCPWNKFAKPTGFADFRARPELAAPALASLVSLDDAAFRKLFAGSPIKRIGRDRFVRNVLIAIGNSGDPKLAACAHARIDDPSPLVRAMAAWALRCLVDAPAFAALARSRQVCETDAAVRAEWDLF